MSQLQEIRAHLESGRPITPIEALEQYGCFRLGARIYDLRREGLAIERETVEATNRKGETKRFARYRLARETGGGLPPDPVSRCSA